MGIELNHRKKIAPSCHPETNFFSLVTFQVRISKTKIRRIVSNKGTSLHLILIIKSWHRPVREGFEKANMEFKA